MEKWKNCRVLILAIVFWCAAALFGYIGKDSIYNRYEIDAKKESYVQMVLWGIHDQIYPWDLNEEQTVMAADIEEKAEEAPEVEVEEEPVLLPREYVQVPEFYFKDALFIGDSRVVGLKEYVEFQDATFFAGVGLSIYDIWKKSLYEDEEGKKTLDQLLSERTFKRIYLELGINELAYGSTEGFFEAYKEAVDMIRAYQPDACIFVQSILHISDRRQQREPNYRNEKINERNAAIAQLEDRFDIFYLNINEVFDDENGNLSADTTGDGLHLYANEYNRWKEYLMTKGILKEGEVLLDPITKELE